MARSRDIAKEKGTGMLAKSPWPEYNTRRSPLVDLPCSVDEVLSNVDAVVVTHVHPDHFESHTAALIDHGLPVFAQSEEDAQTAVNHGNVSRTYLRTFCDRHGRGDQVLIPADGETLEFL